MEKLFKNIISALHRHKRRKKETAKKKYDLERGVRKKESARTCIHARHCPDVPGGEITIEGISVEKHCTTPGIKKSNEIHVWVVKRGERNILVKIKIKKKDPESRQNTRCRERASIGKSGHVNVLASIFVTFPTCHVERSPLKAPAWANTAPYIQQQRKVQ